MSATAVIALLVVSAGLEGLPPTGVVVARQDLEATAGVSSGRDCYSVATIEDWAARIDPDTPVGGYTSLFFTLVHGNQEFQVLGAAITGRFFAALDTAPGAGRLLDVLDDQPNAAPAVVVSHELWQTWFGGRPILGEDLSLDGRFYTVVGIAPQGFSFPETGTALWTSVAVAVPEAISVTEARFLRIVGPTSY